MPEPEPLEAAPDARPAGAVRHAWFGGILEGRMTDAGLLKPLVRRLNQLGMAEAELELEGGRFSLMLDDAKVPGERMTDEAMRDFAGLLQDLVEASGAPHAAESTLHCTCVYDDAVVETLFQVTEEGVAARSRVRPLEQDDARQRPEAVAAALRRIGTRRAALMGALLLVVFVLMAWVSGYLDRLLSHSAEDLAHDTGPFGETLALSVEKSWGNYKVTLVRGPDYPANAAEAALRAAELTGLVEKSAYGIVVAGGRMYVQLLDKEQKVLASKEVELRALLTSGDAEVTAKLPGRIRAHALRLSLERGLPQK